MNPGIEYRLVDEAGDGDHRRLRYDLRCRGETASVSIFPVRGKWQYRFADGPRTSKTFATPNDALHAAVDVFAEDIQMRQAPGKRRRAPLPAPDPPRKRAGVTLETDPFGQALVFKGYRGHVNVLPAANRRWRYRLWHAGGREDSPGTYGTKDEALEAAAKALIAARRRYRKEGKHPRTRD